MSRNLKIYKCSVLLVLLVLVGCSDVKEVDSKSLERRILLKQGLTRDYSADLILEEVIGNVNLLAGAYTNKKLALRKDYNGKDSHSLLIIPFNSEEPGKTSAYSDLKEGVVLIQPQYVKSFAERYALNDTSAVKGIYTLLLMHELGHFVIGKSGEFDRRFEEAKQTGEIDLGLEPQILNSIKRVELRADSLAIVWVKAGLVSKDLPKYSVAQEVQLFLPGMQFIMSSLRVLSHFGSPTSNLLKDKSVTHPNLELRITFMNYYLFPTPERKQLLDDFLYEREVAPVHRQEMDPRIFQGTEKILPNEYN
jgi:hypothetical protein